MNGISVFESEDKFNNTTISKVEIDGEVGSLYNILIEIDEHLSQFLESLKVGSIFSFSQLVSHATKYECEHCQNVFYSSKLYKDHLVTHSCDSVLKNVIEMAVTKCEEEYNTDPEVSLHDLQNSMVPIVNKEEEGTENICGAVTRLHQEPVISIQIQDDTEMEDGDETTLSSKHKTKRNKMFDYDKLYNKETMKYACDLCDKEFEDKKKIIGHRYSHMRIMKKDKRGVVK